VTAVVLPRRVDAPDQYGPVPPGFHLDLTSSYTTLIGPNNAGKSALLQQTFRHAFDEFGSDNVCYIGSDRNWIQPNTQPGGRTLVNYNDALYERLRSGPLQFQEGAFGQLGGELFRLLLHRGDFQRQLYDAQNLMLRLGLPAFQIKGQQDLTFEAVVAAAQGSGLRALLPIVAALSTSELKMIAIDEPEVSLEPILAKALRGVLLESARHRLIVVATHSHLIPNRDDLTSTILVSKQGGFLRAEPIGSQEVLADITFQMLGNSTEDLFFPGNFLVVEGASDQRVADRVLELQGVPRGKVKVLSAEGIDSISDTIGAVHRSLVPIWTADSPYAKRVVAMIDSGGNAATVGRLQRNLSKRLFILPAPSLEEYIPEALYAKAGEDKTSVMAELRAASGSYVVESATKARVSAGIAATMSDGDLALIPEIRDAVSKAVELAP
jgi:hypothetical protein